jgi:hypothetical protein
MFISSTFVYLLFLVNLWQMDSHPDRLAAFLNHTPLPSTSSSASFSISLSSSSSSSSSALSSLSSSLSLCASSAPSSAGGRPGGYRDYSAQELKFAVDEHGRRAAYASFATTSSLFSVPKTTLYDHFRAAAEGKTVAPSGRPTVMDHDDEVELADWIRVQAAVNLPAHRSDILESARLLVEARRAPGSGPHFKGPGGRPTLKWWKRFQKRHGPFAVRRAQHLHPGLPTRADIISWTDGLRKIVATHGITRSRVWNVDETGVDGRYGMQGKLVVPKEQRTATTVTPHWRGHYTCVICISADGKCIPPHWISKGKGPISASDAKTMLHNAGIPGAGVSNQKNAWMDAATWSIWLQFFIANLAEKPTSERPVLLILDSHSSRFVWQNVKYAMDHHIIIYALLPNATSIQQPLDASLNGVFKVFFFCSFVLFFF